MSLVSAALPLKGTLSLLQVFMWLQCIWEVLKVFYNQARVKPLTSSSSSAQDCLSFCSQCLSAAIVWHFQAYINHCVGQALLFCRNSYKTWQGSHQNQVLSPKRIMGFCSQHPQRWQVSEYPQNVSWCKTCALSLFETWKQKKSFFWASLSEFESSLTMTKYLPIFMYLFIWWTRLLHQH